MHRQIRGGFLNNNKLKDFRSQVEKELKENILEFWIDYSRDYENGGFYGYISRDLKPGCAHDKSSVLNARILWTFSSAYRIFREKKYFEIASLAYEYIKYHFADREYSGIYWQLDYKGRPIDTRKKVYAIAFAIYGLSEYYRATFDFEALAYAIDLYRCLERFAHDPEHGGYIDAFARDWSQLSDMSLSRKDMNVPKTMNTHLHALEAYTNLLKAWDSDMLRNSLRNLLLIMLDRIIDNETWSMNLFFSMDWNPCSNITSYGHNIEGSWLICETAGILGDKELLKRTEAYSVKMAERVLRDGMDMVYGGIYNEIKESVLDDNKDWWPQAEAVVGFYNAYQVTGNAVYLDASLKVWEFIRNHIVDHVRGEWFYGVTRDGSRVTGDEKAGFWKCPYHNSRMCFEIISRIK
jgi:mannobiose 2-epimerase